MSEAKASRERAKAAKRGVADSVDCVDAAANVPTETLMDLADVMHAMPGSFTFLSYAPLYACSVGHECELKLCASVCCTHMGGLKGR